MAMQSTERNQLEMIMEKYYFEEQIPLIFYKITILMIQVQLGQIIKVNGFKEEPILK